MTAKAVLLTRPAERIEALAELARERGWQPLALPLFTTETLLAPEALRQRLAEHAGADWWIFTSRAAVEAVAVAAPETWARTAAIGAATAASLTEAGHPPDAVPPDAFHSEALLELPDFAQVAGQRIVLIGVDQGRDTLAHTLGERGAQVMPLPVYRMQPVEHAPEAVTQAVATADVVLLTSGGAAERLWDIAPPEARQRLSVLPFVVSSERVAVLAELTGMRGSNAVAQPLSDAALLDAARRLTADTLTPMTDEPMTDEKKDGAPVAAGENAAPEGAEATTVPMGGKAQRVEEREASGGQQAVAPPPRRSGRLGWLLFVLWLLLLAAVAGAGWWMWQQYEAQRQHVADMEQRVAAQLRAAEGAVDDAAAALRAAEGAAAIAGGLDDAVSTLSQDVAKLQRTVEGGRTRAALAATEQLLVQANERLLLVHDAAGARTALGLADERIAELNDPRLHAVRQAIARERAALAELEPVDRTALALRLSTLIGRAGTLRVRGGVPDMTAPDIAAGARAEAEIGNGEDRAAWQRVGDAVRQALSSVFVVQRTDQPVRPFMAPEDQGMVRGVLLLRLESARLALFAGDQAGYEGALDSANTWLETQFASGDTSVERARSELRDLRGQRLAPVLPDITDSLTRLRQAMQRIDGENS